MRGDDLRSPHENSDIHGIQVMKKSNNVRTKNILSNAIACAIAAVALGLSGCNEEALAEEQADTNTNLAPSSESIIYKNGAIYTVNPKQPWAEALVIRDGMIEFVGSTVEASEFAVQGTQIIDLAGKMLMPGFHDVHIHPLESGSENNHFVLNTEETNPENFVSVIKKAAAEFPDDEWLIGYGHDIETLLNSKRSPIEILNEAVNDRPVIIMEQTSHSMWVNSRALTLAGFDKQTANPVGGVIMKDELSGEPNGILIDNAGNIVMDIAMAPTATRLQRDYDGLVEYTLPALAENGITSIADARAYWKRDHHKTWQKVEKNDALSARVVLGLWAYPEDDDAEQLATLKSLYSNDPNRLLRANQIKLYSDGITSNTTAAMHSPYEFDMLGLAGNKGLNYFTQARLEDYITALEPEGFDFHIHAIGERGIHESLNAIENAGSDTGRHRITHVEVLNPSDYTRFEELNVTADCQVAGEFTHPEHWGEMSDFIGEDRANNLVPLKTLQESGARVTLSSDWSVSPFNPFIGLQNAVTRAPQNLSLKEAIQAYTINSAYVMRQENIVGSIEVGKEADIVVLNQNLFEIDPQNISQTKVLQTLLSGNEVYRSPSFNN